MKTVKIKPEHPSQGEFVVINKADFDPAKHELLDSEKPKRQPSAKKEAE